MPKQIKRATALTITERESIKTLTVQLAQGKKTIYDVLRDGKYVGQVRITAQGQFCRERSTDQWTYVVSHWRRSDPEFGKALVELLEMNSFTKLKDLLALQKRRVA